jgi:hypothetical protein
MNAAANWNGVRRAIAGSSLTRNSTAKSAAAEMNAAVEANAGMATIGVIVGIDAKNSAASTPMYPLRLTSGITELHAVV